MAVFHTPMITLSDGNLIPQIGLGVLRIDDEGVTPVVESALEAGYRHIDGAAGYNNEAGVGRALKNAGFTQGENRKNLWVTTKLRDSEQGYDSARKAFDRQLGLLQLDYVDMYMLHWPTPFDWRSGETWKAFDEFRAEGRVRSLGVCNFLPEHLERLHKETGEYPAVDQIELHPTWQQREVVAYCKAHNIAVEAYSPMARGADLNAGDGVIERIARAHGVTRSAGDPAVAHRKRHDHHSQVGACGQAEAEPRPVRIRTQPGRACGHRCARRADARRARSDDVHVRVRLLRVR